MISKSEYAKVSKNWGGRIYQKMETEHVKLRYFERYLDLFKGKDVLEVGCNAGLFGWHIAKVANSYVGVEKKEHWYQHACETLKHMPDNSKFVNKTLEYYAKEDSPNHNALFMCYVMYHMRADDLAALHDIILPKCDVVVAFNRNTRRRKENNGHSFEKMGSVVKFLEGEGFKCEKKMEKLNRFHVVVGKK